MLPGPLARASCRYHEPGLNILGWLGKRVVLGNLLAETLLGRDLQMVIPTVIVSSVADTRVPGLTPTSVSTIEDFTRGLTQPPSFSCRRWLVQVVYTLGTQLYPGALVTGPGLSKWNRVLRARWGFWRCQDSGGSRTSASQVSPVTRLGKSSEKTTFPLCV